MATFDLTAAADALKIWYQDPITNQVVDKSDLLNWYEQNSEVKESNFGKYVEVSNIYGNPEGVGARAENDYIPVALSPAFLAQQIYLKYLYGTVQLTQQTMSQMKRGKAAFADWADVEVRGMERSIRQDGDRQLYGFGAGHIGRVNDGAPSATDLGVDSGYGATDIGGAVNLFRFGGSYRFFADAAASTAHNSGDAESIVTGIDRDGDQVTFDGVPSDIADDDFIIRGDAAGHSGQDSSGDNREMMGLLGHVDDGTLLSSYFGQNRSSATFLNAQVIDGAASPYNGNLTELLLMRAADDAIQFGNGDPDAIITSRGVLRNFYANLKNDRILNDRRSAMKGAAPSGQGADRPADLSILLGDREVILRAGRQCPEGHLFMLTREHFQRLHNTGWEWDDTTGSMWKQVTDSTGQKDAWYGFGRWFMETFCTSPQAQTLIKGLSETVA